MAKYHISKNGSPAICKAKPGNCPLMDDLDHVEASSVEEAQKVFDNINKEKAEAEDMLNAYSGDVKDIKTDNPLIIAEQIRQYNKKFPISNNVNIARAHIQTGQHIDYYINDARFSKDIEGYYKNQASLGIGEFTDNKYIFKEPKILKLNKDNKNKYKVNAVIFSEHGPVYECDMGGTAEAYAKELKDCYNYSVGGKSVTDKKAKDLKEETAYVIMSTDGHAGAVVTHDNEIGAVFSNADQYNSIASRGIVRKAFPSLIKNGGEWLNCYNTNLPRLYSKQGLYVNAYLEIDEDCVPDEYKTKEFREEFPEFNEGVVFMSLKNKPVKRFNDWNKAEDYTRKEIENER